MTAREPLVSVIIPCHNLARFLGEAIESVFEQTYARHEIIVVDDSSPDNTAEVAARYHPRVRYIRQENQGPAGARNTGLRESRGGYIVFLDADDRLLPEALETNLRHLDAHPECAFAAGGCQAVALDGALLPIIQRPYVGKEYYLELLRDNYIWMPAMVMFRRAAVESVTGFDTSMRKKGAEDYDLYLRVARDAPICCYDKVVAQYRQHDTSVSSNSARMLQATLAVLHSQWNYVKGDKERVKAWRTGIKNYTSLYGVRSCREAWSHVRTRRWKQALRSTRVLLRLGRHTLPVLAPRLVWRWLQLKQ